VQEGTEAASLGEVSGARSFGELRAGCFGLLRVASGARGFVEALRVGVSWWMRKGSERIWRMDMRGLRAA
jgi:hypothetical protein